MAAGGGGGGEHSVMTHALRQKSRRNLRPLAVAFGHEAAFRRGRNGSSIPRTLDSSSSSAIVVSGSNKTGISTGRRSGGGGGRKRKRAGVRLARLSKEKSLMMHLVKERICVI